METYRHTDIHTRVALPPLLVTSTGESAGDGSPDEGLQGDRHTWGEHQVHVRSSKRDAPDEETEGLSVG